jgi:2-amino-4-hydroxy-6-hydroxymethyldihydropteridine diphosphokinase
MTLAYIGLGSNLGHPRRQIARAVRMLSRLPRTRLLAVSPNYTTAPQDVVSPQPDYLNAVAIVDTALAPRALLALMQAIERRHHRKRSPNERNAPRTLDLELLLFGRRRVGVRDLTIPHPRMHARAFVLRPLADVAQALAVPGHGPVKQLLRSVAGQRVVRTRTHRLPG